MQFVHQGLVGAMLLALLPLLIHLINLVRQQRTQWAAMEFLLASYRKHRQWIWLKQFLLMLSRMIIIALLVMMCAQWVTPEEWLTLLGGKVVHHYVVLDDTYSMSQQAGGQNAFDAATKLISQLVQAGGQQSGQQKLTLLRASRMRRVNSSATGSTALQLATLADFNAAPINSELVNDWEQRRQRWSATELAGGLREPLEKLVELIDPAATEQKVVYLLSDSRKIDWESPAELRTRLHELEQAGCEVHLLDCSRRDPANLGVVGLASETDTKAAGVPMFVVVEVRNFGTATQRRIPVKLRTKHYPVASAATKGTKPTVEELPAVMLDEILPGETARRRVQVFFPQPGQHVVEAELPGDAVATDNTRHLVVECTAGEKVLVIDGSLEQQHAYYLGAALHPLERSNTGVTTEIQPVSFLSEATLDSVRQFASIFLLDVPRLDERARNTLLQFAREGGGIAIFAGDNVEVEAINTRANSTDEGVWPLVVKSNEELPAAAETATPDFQVGDHPVFQFFRGEQNSFLAGVTIKRYLAAAPVSMGDDPSYRTLATLRNGRPLVVEKTVGAGRIVACLTTLAPVWNDWAKNPSFVVMLLKLQAYLAAGKRPETNYVVGQTLPLRWEADRFHADVTVLAPGEKSGETAEYRVKAAKTTSDTNQFSLDLATTENGADRSGIYEAWATTLNGEEQVRRLAINADPQEGNLLTLEPETVLQQLAPLKTTVQRVELAESIASRNTAFNRSLWVMALLLLLMLGEQALSYSASYHPARGVVR